MFNRFAPLAAVCVLAPFGSAPLALADPPADPAQPVADPAQPVADAGPPPDTGAVPSEVPGIANSPDGWTLEVSAKDETQLAIPPLTTALSSREYLVGGTFTGVVKGSGKTKLSGGVLEAGYQIGCGISLNTVKLNGSVGLGITTTSAWVRYLPA